MHCFNENVSFNRNTAKRWPPGSSMRIYYSNVMYFFNGTSRSDENTAFFVGLFRLWYIILAEYSPRLEYIILMEWIWYILRWDRLRFYYEITLLLMRTIKNWSLQWHQRCEYYARNNESIATIRTPYLNIILIRINNLSQYSGDDTTSTEMILLQRRYIV